jgi:hypothetical protein
MEEGSQGHGETVQLLSLLAALSDLLPHHDEGMHPLFSLRHRAVLVQHVIRRQDMQLIIVCSSVCVLMNREAMKESDRSPSSPRLC